MSPIIHYLGIWLSFFFKKKKKENVKKWLVTKIFESRDVPHFTTRLGN